MTVGDGQKNTEVNHLELLRIGLEPNELDKISRTSRA